MGWILFIILAVITVVLGVASLVVPAFTESEQDVPVYRRRIRAAAAVAASLAVVCFVAGGIREVPTRSVGVTTSFGTVESSLGSGMHWKLPWKTVNIMDEAIQTTTFEGANCLTVRIGGQQTACLDVTLQWRILDSGASQLFNDYNGQGSSNATGQTPSTKVPGGIMGNVTNDVVIRELEQVVNQVLGDYNPLTDITVTSAGTVSNSQFTTFGPVVLRDMQHDLAGKIQVVSAILPLLRYDSATQAEINTVQKQVADTAIANAEYQTNQAQAKANSAIASSVSANPAVLEYQCLQMVEDAIKANYTGLPATLSCLGSSSVVSVGK